MRHAEVLRGGMGVLGRKSKYLLESSRREWDCGQSLGGKRGKLSTGTVEAGARGRPGCPHHHLTFIFRLVASLTRMQIIKITIDVSISYNLRSDYI